jgi:hypothetical protein
MSKKHEEIVEQIILDWSREKRGRLFKNHQGTAWIGKPLNTNKKNAIVLEYPKKITFGLTPGSSDLIGFEFVDGSNDIYENIVPIICSIEVKTKASPKITDDQKDWLNYITKIGGRAYLAEENEDNYLLNKWEMI